MKKKAFKAAFPYTIPIGIGFLFLGMSYGFMMQSKGFSVWYPFFMSMFIFAGSMEFVTANLLLSAFSPIAALFLALMVNARHLFYGISMVYRYKGAGKKKPYMIYALTDETYSLVCGEERRHRYYFTVSLLDQIYWVTGSVCGSLLGSIIPFNTEGIDFALTALFLTVFVEQWLSTGKHGPALAGLGASVLCLIIFGADNFLIPTMVLITVILTLMRKRIEAAEAGESGKEAWDE